MKMEARYTRDKGRRRTWCMGNTRHDRNKCGFDKTGEDGEAHDTEPRNGTLSVQGEAKENISDRWLCLLVRFSIVFARLSYTQCCRWLLRSECPASSLKDLGSTTASNWGNVRSAYIDNMIWSACNSCRKKWKEGHGYRPNNPLCNTVNSNTYDSMCWALQRAQRQRMNTTDIKIDSAQNQEWPNLKPGNSVTALWLCSPVPSLVLLPEVYICFLRYVSVCVIQRSTHCPAIVELVNDGWAWLRQWWKGMV